MAKTPAPVIYIRADTDFREYGFMDPDLRCFEDGDVVLEYKLVRKGVVDSKVTLILKEKK